MSTVSKQIPRYLALALVWSNRCGFVWARCIRGLFLLFRRRAFSTICIAETKRKRKGKREREKEGERPLSSRLFPVAFSTGIEHWRAIVDRISHRGVPSSLLQHENHPETAHRVCRPRWWSNWREEKERKRNATTTSCFRSRAFLLRYIFVTFDWIAPYIMFQIHRY